MGFYHRRAYLLKGFTAMALMWCTLAINAQVIIWEEDFSSYPNGTIAGSGSGASPANWNSQSGAAVSGGLILASNTRNISGSTLANPLVWITDPIDISSYAGVDFSVNTGAFDSNQFEDSGGAQDNFTLEYRINGGSWVQVFSLSGSPSQPISTSYSITGLSGSNLQIRASFHNTAGNENYTLDNIRVTTTSQPPVLSVTGDQFYCPGTSIPVVESISLTDPDDTTAFVVAIQISTGYVPGEDLLTLTGSHPSITATWSAVEGKLTLTGPALLTEFEAAISAVEYSSSAPNPSGSRSFSISVGDANFLPSTGHFYEFVPALGIRWTDARTAAAARTYYGLQGYLATLTSQEEADFSGSQAPGTGWIGGSDAATEGVWEWVTGPEAGTVFWNGTAGGSSPNFAFWNTGEPNQSGNEDYAHITHPNVNPNGSWNDLSNTGAASGNYQPQGYVVEYGGMPGDPVLSISGVTTLTMLVPPAISAQPSDASVCPDTPASFAVSASGGTSFQWQRFNGSTWVDLADDAIYNGTQTETLNLVSAPLSLNGSQYRMVLSGCSDLISDVATLSVSDTTDPVITGCPADIAVNNDPGSCGAVVTWTMPAATDDCGSVTLSSNNYDPGDTFLPGVTTVVYTATDAVGNSSSCSFTVTVNDTEPPEITGPGDLVVSTDPGSCSANVTFPLPVVADNCAAGPGTFPVGSGFEVPSRNDLINECWQFFGTTVSASNPISGSRSMRTSNLIPSDSRTLISPLTYFNGTGQIIFSHRISQVRNNNRITVSLVDESDVASAIFSEVYATNSPQTEAIDVNLTGNYRVRFDFDTDASASDRAQMDDLVIPGLLIADTSGSGACPAAALQVQQTSGLASGSDYPIGTTTNTFQATDAFGNTVSYSFDITVEDTEAPVASNPGPITVYCAADIPLPDPNIITDEADNCATPPTVSFIGEVSNGGSNPEEITRTYRISDTAGNTTDIIHIINLFAVGISAQPSNANIFAGQNANYSVTDQNANTYQWQVSTDGGSIFTDLLDGPEYAGSSTSALTVLAPDIEKSGYLYRVIVSNSASVSCPDVISSGALLTISPRRVITNRRITYRVNPN